MVQSRSPSRCPRPRSGFAATVFLAA
jgi:hypothetical protein